MSLACQDFIFCQNPYCAVVLLHTYFLLTRHRLMRRLSPTVRDSKSCCCYDTVTDVTFTLLLAKNILFHQEAYRFPMFGISIFSAVLSAAFNNQSWVIFQSYIRKQRRCCFGTFPVYMYVACIWH